MWTRAQHRREVHRVTASFECALWLHLAALISHDCGLYPPWLQPRQSFGHYVCWHAVKTNDTRQVDDADGCTSGRMHNSSHTILERTCNPIDCRTRIAAIGHVPCPGYSRHSTWPTTSRPLWPAGHPCSMPSHCKSKRTRSMTGPAPWASTPAPVS